MAMATILRRTRRQAMSLASRTISTSQARHHYTATAISTVKPTSLSSHFLGSAASRRLFCTDAGSSNSSYSETLLASMLVMNAPSDHPMLIMKNNSEEKTITITRLHDNDTVTYVVLYLKLVTSKDKKKSSDIPSISQLNMDLEYGEQHTNGKSSSASNLPAEIPFVVVVSEKNGPFWIFHCTAYPNDFSINSLALVNPDNEDELAYECLNFRDLDENLRKVFRKYMEIKEIKPSKINLIFRWVRDCKLGGHLD